MATPEDIDAFFDALVDNAAAEEEEQQLLPPPPTQQQQQAVDAPPLSGGSSVREDPGPLATAPTAAATAAAAAATAAGGEKAAAPAAAPIAAPPAAAASGVSEPFRFSQSSIFRPPDRQYPGISSHPSLLERPVQQQQQQQQQDGYLREPPELRPEPPYEFQPYGGSEQGRQQQAKDAEMQTAALCSSTRAVSRLIESKLKENEQMLFAVHENMTVGRYDEALCYFERLQQNLLFLAMLADQHRGGLTEASVEAQQQAFYANRDFWSHDELQRLHHALRTPGQDLQQLAAAVGSKSSPQILSYLSHAADRHLMHRAAAASAVASAATAAVGGTAAAPAAAMAAGAPAAAMAAAAPAAAAAADAAPSASGDVTPSAGGLPLW